MYFLKQVIIIHKQEQLIYQQNCRIHQLGSDDEIQALDFGQTKERVWYLILSQILIKFAIHLIHLKEEKRQLDLNRKMIYEGCSESYDPGVISLLPAMQHG